MLKSKTKEKVNTELENTESQASSTEKPDKKAEKPKKEPETKVEKSKKEPKIKAEKPKKEKLPKEKPVKEPKVKKPKKEKAPKDKTKRKGLYFSFAKKLIVLFCIPFVLVAVITTTLCTDMLTENINNEIQELLRTVAHTLNTTYENVYEGEYSRDMEYRVVKGDVVITNNVALIDAVHDQSGVESSIYFEGSIISTTFRREAGGRATGTAMEKDLYARILAGEEFFLPAYEVQGRTYYGYFIPLKNGDTVVGAIFAGRLANEVQEKIDNEIRSLTIVLVAVMAAFLVLLIIFARYLSKSMKKTMKFLKRVAEGELAYSAGKKGVRNRDEIGDIYRSAMYLQNELKDIVGNMKNSAGTLLATSDQLKSVSGRIHDNVSETYASAEVIVSDAELQAKETDQTVDKISEIANQIEYVTKEMESLQKNMQSMSEAEETSYNVMIEFAKYNKEAMDAIDEVAQQVEITNKSVQQIQNTINIIRDIADETDLLSMNANIEAAHAGDAGRGFSVIAEEINKLAGQSAQNAVNVEKTLMSLKTESEKMVTIMDKVKEMMNMQSGRLAETITNFEVVEQGVTDSRKSVDIVRQHMGELTNSKDVVLENVHKQATIAERFVNTTESVTDMVKAVDERMKELEKTAEELEVVSNEMNSGLDVFKF